MCSASPGNLVCHFYHYCVCYASEFSPFACIFLDCQIDRPWITARFPPVNPWHGDRRFNEMHYSGGAYHRMSGRAARHRAAAPRGADNRAVRPGGRYRRAERARIRRRPSAAGGAPTAMKYLRRSSASATVWRRRCRSARSTGLVLAAPPCSTLARRASRTAERCRCRMTGWAACWIHWAGRWTARGRCRPVLTPAASAPHRPMRRTGAAGSAARCRRARAQLLRHLPPGTAARPVLRLRHRQVEPARHAGAPHRLRCRRAGPGRRAGTRGAGIPRGRSGRGGLARSVVVVATSDSPPLLRREAAFAAMTVAEHFRDQGQVGAAADGQRYPVLPGIA